MKLKYYLRGLGVGILFTALIFSFIVIPEMKKDWNKGVQTSEPTSKPSLSPLPKNSATPKPTQTPEPTPSPQLNPSDTPASPTPTDVPVTSAPTEVPETPTPTEAPATPTPTEVPATPTPTEVPATPTPTVTVVPTPTNVPVADGEKVQFRVTSGMTSEKAAKALKDAGLITDQDGFNRYMITHHYDWKIMVGTYTLRKGMTYEEICKTICR